ncbi:MAG: hypothetical protein KDB23_27975, partial [Planctomycetales bacterium]|nr:hypothetical protein [Planctomycetales bacterium]
VAIIDLPRILPYLLLVVTLIAWSYWNGRLQRSATRGWLSRLLRPFSRRHVTELLRELHVATSRGRPAAGVISSLARYHYDPAVRQHLLFARNEIEHGAEMWSTLGKAGLLGTRDVRLLTVAPQRTWPWLLPTMADQQQGKRRMFLAWLAELALPVTVIGWGIVVFSVAWSIFNSLALMIRWS